MKTYNKLAAQLKQEQQDIVVKNFVARNAGSTIHEITEGTKSSGLNISIMHWKIRRLVKNGIVTRIEGEKARFFVTK